MISLFYTFPSFAIHKEKKKNTRTNTHTQRLRQQADNGVNILLCSSNMKAILLIFNGVFFKLPRNGNESHTYRATHIKHYKRSELNKIGPYGRVSKDITWAYYLWWLISNAILVYRYIVFALFFPQPKLKPSNECVQCERVQARKSVVRLVVAVAFLCFLVLFGCQRQVCPARIVQLNSKLHFDRWSWLVIIFRWKVDIIQVFISFLRCCLAFGFNYSSWVGWWVKRKNKRKTVHQ